LAVRGKKIVIIGTSDAMLVLGGFDDWGA